MINLSDGNTDGIVLFYQKDHKVYPVILNQEQIDFMEAMFGAFGTLKVLDEEQNIILERWKKK